MVDNLDRMACPHCGSHETTITLTPDGPHHGELRCSHCKRQRWLPRPRVPSGRPSAELVGRARRVMGPAHLEGTYPQTSWASTLRARMITTARRAGDGDWLDVLLAVADARWFIGNRDRAPEYWEHPTPDQLAGGEVSPCA